MQHPQSLSAGAQSVASQQSRCWWPAAQLLLPHTRLPAHWLSLSQSPCPTPHGAEAVQQLQSLAAGLHFSVLPPVVEILMDVVEVVAAVVVADVVVPAAPPAPWLQVADSSPRAAKVSMFLMRTAALLESPATPVGVPEPG